jgi:microcystin degradation protein MlrC
VAGLIARTAGAGAGLSLVIGASVNAAIVVLLVYVTMRVMERGRRLLETRFAR